jgi:hypothetical protein
MRSSISLIVTGALAALSLQLVSSTASAGAEACQNIQIGADAKCEVVVSGGCVAMCEPVSFEASCSAELYVQCDGQCTANPTVTCSASCDATCQGECKVDPPKYDCSAGCRADCSANCDAQCAASANKGECAASCRSTCTGDCDAQCTGTKPDASCDAKCKASCDGSCEAQANFNCQIDCQSKSFAKCETDLKGGCEAQCTKPDGALFCDGQYIDTRDQLKDCLAYLEGTLKIDVQGYANGDADCSGNTCTAEGEAGVSCAAAPLGPSGAPLNEGALALAAIGAGILVARRRRG